MINDGLWCTFEDWHMGNAGEVVAVDFGVTRAAQDEFAANSHRKAAAAAASGRFRSEIVPISIPEKKGDALVFDRDESVRPETTIDTLAALRPAFKADGTVTAGNAPPVNDGASALVVMSERRARELGIHPMARIAGQATSGLAPKYVLMTPVEAIRRLVKKIGWSLEEVDLFEINEAFSVQMVAILGTLGIDATRVNVNGGAVALGHPIGASGARILTTLLYALEERGLRRGIAALCLGGGNGVAVAVERV
jgi:acetyl-CoA C-acetyltransferase